jgi:hypothetical protein
MCCKMFLFSLDKDGGEGTIKPISDPT